MKRFECIRILAEAIANPLVVTTAGGATHEWWAFGDNRGQIAARTLGLCSSIGLGLALALPSRRILVLDGDGGLLMNLNTLATSSIHSPPNMVHLCFDNGIYESSGGTPTFTSRGINLASIGAATGISSVHEVDTLSAFRRLVNQVTSEWLHTLIVVKVEPGLAEIPPIAVDEVENKYRFARYIEETEGKKILRGPTSPVTGHR